jgi:ribosomal protein L18E
MAKRSNYQDRIIRNYYQNRDTIMLQRLGELVTDLFLAEGKTKARVWKRVAEILEKLKVPKSQIEHLVRADNPTLVANLLKKLLEESG